MCGSGKYIYGILENADAEAIKDIKGIDDLHTLYILKTEDFFIALSDVDLAEYGEGEIDKRLEDMVWVQDKAQKHFEIIQQLLHFGTIIPMKFCTIFVSEDSLKQFIEGFKQKIREAISYLKDKEEWEIKVFCDKKKFLECNMEEEKEALQKNVGKASKGAAYFMAKKLQSSLEEKSKEKIIKLKDTFWNEIKGKADQVTLNKNLSRQVMDYDKDMILNAALLMKKDEIKAFLDEIEKKENFLLDYNMEIKVSGPWPFYNFTTMFIS